MHALILAPSDNNPGFLEVFTSITTDEVEEETFLDRLEYYESLPGWQVWLTEKGD
tara:strand:+ start:219 stop:383 length:165 start_codon:yes stop_codon:yes gene_type:complete